MLPPWVSPVEKVLALAVDRIHLISAVTPVNAVSEVARLEDGFRRGLEPTPSWRYDPTPVPIDIRRALDAVMRRVESETPLGPIYAARARELALEASMIDAVATPWLRTLARSRFIGGVKDEIAVEQIDDSTPHEDGDGKGDATVATSECDWVTSDDARDPRSLLCCMQAAIGHERVPFRVVVEPALAALAATGDGVVFVAAGRRMRVSDVRRTVLHEIEGHVLPRHGAATETVGLFAIGTARGIDDQEGRALLIEQAAGFFDRARIRELRLRHAAARLALEGANFVDLARALMERGAETEEVVRISSRVMRGGTREGGGIAREILYLPAMARVSAAMALEGEVVGSVMRRGRIAASLASIVAKVAGVADAQPLALGSA